MKRILSEPFNYVLIFIVFSGGLVFRQHGQLDLRISYVIMAFGLYALIHHSKGLAYNRKALLVFLVLLFTSTWNTHNGNNSCFLLLKQVIGIGMSSFVFYLLVKANKYDVRKLFKVYLNLALIVGLIGLFQQCSYLLDFEPGYDYSYIFPSWKLVTTETIFLRVNSIMPEPATFCVSMMPAFFAAVVSCSGAGNELLTKPKSLVIISSVLLSFSLVGYFGVVFSILLLFYNLQRKRDLILCGLLMPLFALVAYHTIYDVRVRVDDSIGVLTKSKLPTEVNLSTFTLFTNAQITYYSFMDNPVFGTGLGSREFIFNTGVDRVVGNTNSMLLNTKDGNSLFLRLTSELGLFGLISVFYFIYKFHVPKKISPSLWVWAINNSILVLFAVRMLRAGHYFSYGLMFFVCLYYFTGKYAMLEAHNRPLKSKSRSFRQRIRAQFKKESIGAYMRKEQFLND